MLNRFYFIVALLTVSLVSAASGPFNDINWDNPQAFAINYLKQQRIVQGYSDGTFKPNRLINRAELVKILIERNYEASVIANCRDNFFKDVKSTDWFQPHLCVAYKNKLIKGYSDGTFKPAQNINFVEASKIIYLSYGQTDQTTTPWYKPYVVFLHQEKVIPESLKKLDQKINRGQMAEIIYRLRHFDQVTRSVLPTVKSNTPKVQASTPRVRPTETKNTDPVTEEAQVTAPTPVILPPTEVKKTETENKLSTQPTINISSTTQSESNQQAISPEDTSDPEDNREDEEEGDDHKGSVSFDENADYYFKKIDIQHYCPPFYNCIEHLYFLKDGRVVRKLGDDTEVKNGNTNQITTLINAEIFTKSCPISTGFSNAAKTIYLNKDGLTRKFYEPECESDLDPIESFIRSYFEN